MGQKEAIILYQFDGSKSGNGSNSATIQLTNPAVKDILGIDVQETTEDIISNLNSIDCKIFRIIDNKSTFAPNLQAKYDRNIIEDENPTQYVSLTQLMMSNSTQVDKTITLELMRTEIGDRAQRRKLTLSLRNLFFDNKECKVATFHDITQDELLQNLN